jgi:hypothetical protein
VAYVRDDVIRLQTEKLVKNVGISEDVIFQPQSPETCMDAPPKSLYRL